MPATVEREYHNLPGIRAAASEVKSISGQGEQTKAFMPRRNLLALLDDFVWFARDVAVVEISGYRREKVTYAELSAGARYWSHALAGCGIEPGDRVLLWGRNSAPWVACFWGILLRGAVVVPMDATASPDFVARAIQDSGAKLLVRDREAA